MRINIISGPMASGKTTKLRAIQTELEQKGLHPLLITCTTLTTKTLVRTIARQFGRCLTVLLDDCNQEQIDAINHWKKETDRYGQFADLVIHLVKQA